MENVNNAIYRLLHHFSFRQHFISGEFNLLNLQDELLIQLRTIDNLELERTGNKILRNLLYGGGVSEGGLMRSFSETFKLLHEGGMEPVEVAAKFMESSWFDKYQETTFSSHGISVEEAFFRYIDALPEPENNSMGFKFCVKHEFLIALMSILVVNPNPGFNIDTYPVSTNDACQYIIERYPAHYFAKVADESASLERNEMVAYLYAATPNKLVHGPISPLIEMAIYYRSKSLAIKKLAKEPIDIPGENESRQQVLDGLVEMGLLCQ